MNQRHRCIALLFIASCLVSSHSTSIGGERGKVCEETFFVLEEQPIRVSPLAARLRPNRMLVVTCLDRQDRLKEQQALRRAVMQQIRALSTFDAIEHRTAICEKSNPIRSGRFDERQLIGWAREYMVDSVLFCQVTEIDAYRPMRMELAFLLLNADQSVPVASGTLRFDLADGNTEQVFLRSLHSDREAPVTAIASPTRLIEFSAAQFVHQLKSIW
ncbi:MAG: hypothetical protein AAF802_02835 [Planctomycetota bacterium]